VTISHTIAGSDYAAITSADVTATVTDDDEVFASVVIGTQTWSASNVSLVPAANNALGTDYWTTYTGSGGDSSDDDGYFYTWNAAINVCPSGWVLPTDADWMTLEEHLETDVGAKLKEDGSSGFEAKLTGYIQNAQNSDGNGRGSYTHFWSRDAHGNPSFAFRQVLGAGSNELIGGAIEVTHGFSVRCLKDG
jgi:uncharacterized protein (TIGR02145 family)